eukprot:Gb_16726 [translate_table: standard]
MSEKSLLKTISLFDSLTPVQPCMEEKLSSKVGNHCLSSPKLVKTPRKHLSSMRSSLVRGRIHLQMVVAGMPSDEPSMMRKQLRISQDWRNKNKSIWKGVGAGYRHFDTASLYGSECALDSAYKDIFSPIEIRSNPSIKQDDILPVDIKSTWQTMEKCVALGLTREIGVSNFSCKKIEDLVSYATVLPAVNQQVEMHPYWQQKKLLDYCTKLNIHITAWSPLGAVGAPWGSTSVMDNPVIHEIAQKHGKTPAQ